MSVFSCFNGIKNLADGLVLSHAKDSKNMIMFLAVAVYWDNNISDDELDEVYLIIREHFEKLGVDEDEIKYIKNKFIEMLKEFETNKVLYLKKKDELFQTISTLDNKDYYLDILRKVIVSDGIDEKEKNFLKKLNG